MSRIGLAPINIPQGVEVTIDKKNVVSVKGPKGTLTQRVEYRRDGDGATASALMCGGKWAGRRGTYTLRWSQFEVPQSNLRIYEYEEDLPGTFRTAQLNGRGYKWYCSARWQVKKQFDVAAKYHRQTVLPDQGDPILASAENPQTRELWRLQLLVNF